MSALLYLHCLCVHDVALWKYYLVTAFDKFRAAYNKCIKKLFGYARSDSMSGIFLELGLPPADSIVYTSLVLSATHCLFSFNQISTGLLTLVYCNFIYTGLY